MANPNSPFGFRPVVRAGGSPFSLTQYAKPSSDGNAIFVFDLAAKVAAGVTDPAGGSILVPGIKTGYQGTPGTTLWLGASLNYGAASTATMHLVTDEIDVIYIAQCKTGTVIATGSHMGKNANISTTTAGSTTTKMSGLAVDGATLATTATLDLRTLNVSTIVPNAEGDSAILEVMINKHQFAQGAVGV